MDYANNIVSQLEDMQNQLNIHYPGDNDFRISVPRASYIAEAFTAFINAINSKLCFNIYFMETDSLASIISFFKEEVKAGRLTKELLPLQSGVGSVANAVLYGLCDSDFENLTCYSEVVQDSMLDLLRSGKAVLASTTSLSPSPEALPKFEEEIEFFKDKIILRPQEISNNPELARRRAATYRPSSLWFHM
jgi:acyl-CoA hydrolase